MANTTLGLSRPSSDPLAQAELNMEQLRSALARSQRAARLLVDPDFVSWRRQLEADKAQLVAKLVRRRESDQDADIKRGKILAVEEIFAGLEIQAQNLEEISRRIEDAEKREHEPVDQSDWLWGL